MSKVSAFSKTASSRLAAFSITRTPSPGADLPAADEHVLGGGARQSGVVDGQVAQQLLDRARQQGGVLLQLVQLVGVFEEGDGADADHLGHRVVAGEQQQGRHADEFLVVEAALGGAGDHAAEQVLGGALFLGGDQPVEVAHQLGGRLDGLFGGARAVQDGVGEPYEQLVVLEGDTEDLADGHGGHGQRELADQVGGAAARPRSSGRPGRPGCAA
ncbi:hypothetical protein GCM10017687_22810 [Streptomyces echinatus]